MGFHALAFLLLGLIVSKLVNCSSEDALLAQKAAWVDPNNVLQSWDPTLGNPCTWHGIACNTNSSVVSLNLMKAGLAGLLVPDLVKLSYLQRLELGVNNISGSIPAELGEMTSLVSLDLQLNRLSGQIPPSLGNLKSLQYLGLNRNNISGVIPATLGNMSSLVRLNLQHNQLLGEIPPTLGYIRSLQYLRLDGNMLTGEIPLGILSLALTGNLRDLDVSDNHFAERFNSTETTVTWIYQSQRVPN